MSIVKYVWEVAVDSAPKELSDTKMITVRRRVPGGWLYHIITERHFAPGIQMSTSTTFVPGLDLRKTEGIKIDDDENFE